MKKASIFFITLFFGIALNGFSQTTEPVPADFFAGKWETTFLGTPQGDAVLILDLVRKDGKLSGTITPKIDVKSVAIDKIDETADKLILYFKMSGFDINVSLEKEDNDNLKGSLMGMFKVKALRVK